MKPNGLLLILLALSLLAPSAFAEYRVFVLKIQMPGEEGGKLITSTLDPEQYRGYYPVPTGATVTYVETWRCWGRTGQQPPCKKPVPAADPADAASSTDTARETPKKGPERTPASTSNQ